MKIEVREPREGELWWRKDSVLWFGADTYNGLHYYTSKLRGEPFMFRCYAAATDFECGVPESQFGTIEYGRPFNWEPYQLVSGEWFLAAEADRIAEFLRGQVEQYRQAKIRNLQATVGNMSGTIANGKHPHNLNFRWIA